MNHLYNTQIHLNGNKSGYTSAVISIFWTEEQEGSKDSDWCDASCPINLQCKLYSTANEHNTTLWRQHRSEWRHTHTLDDLRTVFRALKQQQYFRSAIYELKRHTQLGSLLNF